MKSTVAKRSAASRKIRRRRKRMDWARKMPRSKTHMAKEFAEFLTSADQSRREQQVELARHAIGLTALPDEVTEWPGYMRRALPLPKYGT